MNNNRMSDRALLCAGMILASVGCAPLERVILPTRTIDGRLTSAGGGWGTRGLEYVFQRGPCFGEPPSSTIGSVEPDMMIGFVVGYVNQFLPGAPPFPCDTQHSVLFVGALKFDLEDLNREIVERAVLLLDRRNTALPMAVATRTADGIVVLPQCDLQWHVRSDAPLTVGDNIIGGFTLNPAGFPRGSAFAEVPNSRAIPAGRPPVMRIDASSSGVVVDVTAALQAWAANVPNHGFLIFPMPGALGFNNDSCTSMLTLPRLIITVRRPRRD